MDESGQTHVAIVISVLAVFVPLWWDLRKKTIENGIKITERFTRLETMIQPLWDWWNKTNGKG